MKINIAKTIRMFAAIGYLIWACSAAWAVYGVKMADLHRNPLPPNPVRIWGTVGSTTPMKISDGKNEVVVTGLTAQIGDLVIVTGNWNGSVLNITASRIFAGPAKIEMISIPAGSFLMGTPDSYSGSHYDSEHPQHSVSLSAYYIGKYEVTRGEYKKFINAGGYSDSSYWSSDGWSWKVSNSRTQPDYWAASQNFGTGSFTQTDNHPVMGVTYYEAEAFCKWAGGRLPTEAEWERAARWTGRSARVYPWGDTWNNEYCNNWWDSNTAGGGFQKYQTSPVGSYSSYGSPSGCQDMAGNVWEWCQDWYSSTYYASSPSSNPTGPASGSSRVVRGGAWNYQSNDCRCACRFNGGPGGYDSNLGFRIVRVDPSTITASAGTGGTISPSGAVIVINGGSQTFTITSNNGYSVAHVLVDGVDKGAISSYTFTNVVADHTISASFSSNYSGEMISIPSGSFLMGNSGIGYDLLYDQQYHDTSEKPQHSVTLSAYYIGKHEVTRGEYRKFINAGGYSNSSYWSSDGWSWKVSTSSITPYYWDVVQTWSTPPGSFIQTDNHPVVGVTYYEAEAFCKWAGGRLPTEAEWERAARWNPATSHPNVYPWGDGDIWSQEYCNNWYDSSYQGYQTSPVGSYSNYGSPSGCQDMAGNVWEWCADWYSSTYYSSSPASNPTGPSTGSYRVRRGGSWQDSYDGSCRCARRYYSSPFNNNFNLGFRIAR